jgi:hypothetical protein
VWGEGGSSRTCQRHFFLKEGAKCCRVLYSAIIVLCICYIIFYLRAYSFLFIEFTVGLCSSNSYFPVRCVVLQLSCRTMPSDSSSLRSPCPYVLSNATTNFECSIHVLYALEMLAIGCVYVHFLVALRVLLFFLSVLACLQYSSLSIFGTACDLLY